MEAEIKWSQEITNTGFRNDFDIIETTDEVSGTGNTDSVTCIVCQKPASNAHSCSKCFDLSSSISFSLKHKKHKTDTPKPHSPFVFPQITCTVLLHFEHEWAFEAGFWHTIHVTLSVFPVPETSSVVSIMSKSFKM
jgi:hypothetical protein